MRRILKEPLLHFFVLGGLLFLLYVSLNRDALRAPDEIVVDQARMDALAQQYRQVWGRSPTAQELQASIDAWVREEVLFREGVQAGLDQDDTVVRRRVVQKMQFMADGMSSGEAAPSDAELQAWLDAHADDYRIAPSYAFAQVYFEPRRHGASLAQEIERVRSALEAGRQDVAGDGSQLPATMPLVSADEVARVFGKQFADGLAGLPDGQWAGPVRSGYGEHLVRISAREAGRLPPLAEVREQVLSDLERDRNQADAERYYEGLRQRYVIKVEGDASAAIRGGATPSANGRARP